MNKLDYKESSLLKKKTCVILLDVRDESILNIDLKLFDFPWSMYMSRFWSTWKMHKIT